MKENVIEWVTGDDEPCCETCRYCEPGESGKLYCENKQADEWYEEVTWHHSCPLWEERDEG